MYSIGNRKRMYCLLGRFASCESCWTMCQYFHENVFSFSFVVKDIFKHLLSDIFLMADWQTSIPQQSWHNSVWRCSSIHPSMRWVSILIISDEGPGCFDNSGKSPSLLKTPPYPLFLSICHRLSSGDLWLLLTHQINGNKPLICHEIYPTPC